MLKALTFALAASAVLAAGATAAEIPANQDECLKMTLALAEKAEAATTLPEDGLTKIEELLTKMEGHCDASRFPDAAAVSAEIEAALAKK